MPSSTLTLTALANSGDADAQCKLGLDYETGKGVTPNFERARTWLAKSAAQHNGCGIVNVGNLYFHGRGVARDFDTARRYYEAGVAQRFAVAYYNLGVMSQYGDGGPVDERAALEWIRRAAAAGYPPAYNKMGDLYAFGRQIPRNIGNAVYYYELAIRAHSEDCTCAEENLAYLYMSYYPGKDRNARAMKYLKMAQDDEWAEYWIASFYLDGTGGVKSIALASSWFKKAADKGYAPAETMYGQMLLGATGARHSAAPALAYLREAAAQGDSDAMRILGELYWDGNGVAQDRKLALSLMEASSEQGNLQALNHIANLYYNGIAPFPRDRYKAYILFHVAVDQGAKLAPSLQRKLAANLSAEQMRMSQGEIQRLDQAVRAEENRTNAPPPIPQSITEQLSRPAD